MTSSQIPFPPKRGTLSPTYGVLSVVRFSGPLCRIGLALVTALVPCRAQEGDVEDSPSWNRVVGFVDERPITALEVVRYVEEKFAPGLFEQMESAYGEHVRHSEVYQRWIDSYLDLLAIRPSLTEGVVKRAEERFEKDLAVILTDRVTRTQSELVETLGLQPLVEVALQRFLREEGLPLYVRVLTEELVDRRFDVQEVRSHFVRHAFRFGGKVKASLIYFSFEDRETHERFASERRAEIQEQAFAVYRELVQGGDFEKMVRLHSDDEGSRRRDGDIEWVSFHGGALPETVLEVAFLTPKGSYARPVVTRRGIFLLRIEDRRNRENPDFHDIREEVERDYRRELARRFLVRRRTELGVQRV